MNILDRAAAGLAAVVLAFAASTAAVKADSGFLDDYGSLQPDPDHPGAMTYRASGVDLKAYDKLLIDPIEVVYDPSSPHKIISPDELKLITDSFYATLVAALEPDYPVVNTPGSGVLRVRLAITGVRLENKKRSLLGYTPMGFAATTVANAAGLRVSLKQAGVEAELLDATTGATLGALVDRDAGTTPGGEASWEALQSALTFYARRFRDRWEAARVAP